MSSTGVPGAAFFPVLLGVGALPGLLLRFAPIMHDKALEACVLTLKNPLNATTVQHSMVTCWADPVV